MQNDSSSLPQQKIYVMHRLMASYGISRFIVDDYSFLMWTSKQKPNQLLNVAYGTSTHPTILLSCLGKNSIECILDLFLLMSSKKYAIYLMLNRKLTKWVKIVDVGYATFEQFAIHVDLVHG